ncbi:MAG TPA: hypothetical protein RMH99_27435 [Sandaracinaceae bacterium LLY-WYZ-13_1]|nr:hypothetical protein [Sandaracinaceae bacterium LLY-WYZ-13_1]
MPWAAVASGWSSDPALADLFVEALAAAPLAAFFWETVPSAGPRRDRPFEQVLLDSPALARMRVDPAPFREPLARATSDVHAFDNLGGDARLVVPTSPRDGPLDAYAHLAAFVRGAPAARARRLFAHVGTELVARWDASEAPVWVSTSGLGVAWVHVRLDARPKYVTHAPYRRFEP